MSKSKGRPELSDLINDRLASLPDKPGVYLMKDVEGTIIYVGKAIILKNRVRSYFQKTSGQLPKVKALVRHIHDLEWIITDSEMEALVLECNLIKRYRPYYNIRLKDDKSYPFIRITIHEKYPRVFLTRTVIHDGSRYFGPYANVTDIKQTLQLLEGMFPLRKCRDSSITGKKRVCLNYHIGKCLGPCQEMITSQEYRKMIDEVVLFLEGRGERLLALLKKEMEEASSILNFERAAVLRDQVIAVEHVVEKQRVLFDGGGDQDVIASVAEGDSVCTTVFLIRGGKLIRKENLWLTSAAGAAAAELSAEIIKRYYADISYIPPEVIIDTEPEDKELLTEWLTELRGKKTAILVPRRGLKLNILKMAQENSIYTFRQAAEKAVRDKEKADNAVQELSQKLTGGRTVHRIECFDISNIQGSEPVASMVVFIDGHPRKSEYRKFKIKTVQGPNDFAMMEEALKRRFTHGMCERALGEDARDSKFADFPDLLIVDGGKGQLSSAVYILEQLGLTDIPVAGLAKQQEEIFLPGESDPVNLPKESEGSRLLQRVRDEAHRFAITFHRSLRDKRTLHSSLDDVPGIGPARRTLLLKTFGSAYAVMNSNPREIKELTGINEKLAQQIIEYLQGELGTTLDPEVK